MSDQQPPHNGDTAAVAGPEGAPGTAQEQAEIDWEKRYQDLQPEYTRATQRASELEQRQQWYDLLVTTDDADTRRQAAEALGFELPDEEEGELEQPYQDPYEELRGEVSSLRERYEQDQSTQRETEEAQIVEGFVFDRLKELDPDLPEGVRQMLVAHAIHALDPIALPPGSVVSALPDIDTAYAQWQSEQDGLMKGWAKTKRAPYVAPGGQTATEAPLPLDATSEQRVRYAMQKLAEAQEPQ